MAIVKIGIIGEIVDKSKVFNGIKKNKDFGECV
jgi:hypothetical protein